ncbi:MAG: hypothetical protein AAFY99_07210 [Pseudomonadota bacterium]
MRFLLSVAMGLTCVWQAHAINEFKTWRINGKDILRVELLPAAINPPGTMRIIFKPSILNRLPLVIESDTGIDECYAWARTAVGNPRLMLEITQWTTSATVNGVIVTSCFTINT